MRAVAGVMAGMVSAAIPPFLVGALSLPIGKDLDFTAADIGVAVAAYYLVSGVLSPVAGRLVARIGVAWSLHLACAASTAGLAAIALANSPTQIVVTLALLGLPNSVVQPASNQVLSGIPDVRVRGLSFGLVQSAIPASTMLAGLLLAVASYGSGWRLAVWMVAALTVAGQALVAGIRSAPPTAAPAAGGSAVGGWPLMAALVAAGFLASAAATSLPSFMASTGTDVGLAPAAVAAAQIAGSVCCVLVRTVAAWRASRLSAPARLWVVAGALTLGCCGYVLLAGDAGWAFMLGAVLAYACGWGWNGLYNLTVAGARPEGVAAATGLTQSGVFLGGAVGPLGFAVLVENGGYPPAWSATAVAGAAATVAILFAARRWVTHPGGSRQLAREVARDRS